MRGMSARSHDLLGQGGRAGSCLFCPRDGPARRPLGVVAMGGGHVGRVGVWRPGGERAITRGDASTRLEHLDHCDPGTHVDALADQLEGDEVIIRPASTW